MTAQEIRAQIDANNHMIEQLSDPGSFTLNSIIADLLVENARLQKLCPHDFMNGECIYCYKRESNE